MPGRAKKENENGLVLFWQWVQKAKAKQHKQCANKKSIFNRGEIMKDEELEELKKEAMSALREAEQKMHKYFAACEVGIERTRAFDVYQNIRLAARVC
jgi:hypothetical protein